jgi:PAS domain S-box-containing protein
MKTRILDFIDFEKVNTLLEGFNQSTGFVTAILDLDGNILSKSGWRQICTEFHRVNTETSQRCKISDTLLAGKMGKGEKYHFYKCLNGLVDVAVPIIIKGEHIANLFSGQFFFEKPDNSFFQKQASRFGFKEGAYMKALEDVPVISEEKVKVIMGFLLNMTHLISDMTFQKMELMELNDALIISEERYRLVLENSMDAILLTSPDGSIISANPAACAMFQRTEEEIRQLGSQGLVNINDSRLPVLIDERNRTGKAKGELLMLRNDGTKFPVEVSTSVFTDQSEKVWSSMIIRDVTERKRTEEQLIISKERAEESDRLKTAFLQNMSHEIRTPMNAIMGFSDLLVKNFDNKTKLQKFSDIIGQRCNDLLDIINDILDIAKIESGLLRVNQEECNLKELFAELSAFFSEYQIRLGKQDIQFSLWALSNPSDNIIITDKVKLKQIFINLIGNAFKFTQVGKIEGGCKIDENNNLLFYVSDTGIGIPTDKQEMVFDRFAQISQGTLLNVGGTGLGLSIVKGLIGLLGGQIYLKSEPGEGSLFTFTFPFVRSQQVSHTQAKPEMIDFNILYNKSILIVEDDLFNAEYIKEILCDKGLRIIHTIRGREAVEICSNQSIDLVLMDIRLPDINGYEAASQMKKNNSRLKIIVQTAYAAQDEKQKAIDAGCVDYISKPTKEDSLMVMIRKHLSSS